MQDVKPGICFRGKPFVRPDGSVDPTRPKSAVLRREAFPDNIDVYWQTKGYFDGATCMAWARNYRRQVKRGEKLHQMDNLGGQADPDFRAFMKDETDTLIHFTPPGCTDLGAACDAGLIYE